MQVVGVVDFAEVVEGPPLLGVGQPVRSPVVVDRDEALLNVDVRGSVLPHGPQLHQMALWCKLLHDGGKC